MTQLRSFLLLSCSQRKRTDPDPLPAFERYDGPQFRVLRKFLRTHPNASAFLDIAILSARFGIISPSTLIPWYDQRLTTEQALRLRQDALKTLQRYFQPVPCARCCLSLSRTYFQAVEGFDAWIPAPCAITIIQGPPGARLSQLFNWLYTLSKETIAPNSLG
jgi:hypothetical protein